MKKELKEGMGFICETLEDKKRIWQKLTDAGYPMFCSFNESLGKHIVVDTDVYLKKLCFMGSDAQPTIPLNEFYFFDEVDDWTPQAGEWVEVLDYGAWLKDPRVFVCEWKGVFYYENEVSGRLLPTTKIRQIKPETMTLQEVREALGKPNLIITQ